MKGWFYFFDTLVGLFAASIGQDTMIVNDRKRENTRRLPFVFLLLCLLLGGCRSAHWVVIQARPSEQVHFLVGDQAGNPVPGVQLELTAWEHHVLLLPVYRPSLKRSFCAKSNEDGNVFVSFKHENLKLEKVTHPGYEFDVYSNSRSWTRRFPPTEVPLQARLTLYDVDNASNPSPHYGAHGRLSLKSGDNEYWVDLAKDSITDLPMRDANLYLSVALVGSHRLITVVALSGGVVLCGNDFPYAPDKGYSPGFASLSSRRGFPATFSFYVKSTDGALYSRVVTTVDDKRGVLSLQHITNTGSSAFLHNEHRKQMSTESRGEHISRNSAWWKHQTACFSSRAYVILSPVEFRNMYAEGQDNDRIVGSLGGQLFTPKDILQAIAAKGQRGASHVLENPILSKDMLKEILGHEEYAPWIRKWGQKTLDEKSELIEWASTTDYWGRIARICKWQD
jgi:hypothetical protein